LELISSYSANAKAKMEQEDKVPKGSKVQVQLEPLDEKTVYYEDLYSRPNTKKKG
jgi:hypothetical protein